MNQKKYRIVNEDGLGNTTKVIDLETNKKLENVQSICISPIDQNTIIQADIKMDLVNLDIVVHGNLKREGVMVCNGVSLQDIADCLSCSMSMNTETRQLMEKMYVEFKKLSEEVK